MTADNAPLLTAAAERDAEERTRRRLTAQRCETVERALEAVGFRRGTAYWSAAMLVARVAGWQPLRRTLDQLAADPDFACRSAKLENRKRSLRRALAELARWQLLTVTSEDGPARRRTRPQSLLVIELNRKLLIAEANGEAAAKPLADAVPIAANPAKLPPVPKHPDSPRDTDKTPDKTTDRTPDKTPDKIRTTKTASSYTLYPNYPSSPSRGTEPAAPATTTTTQEKKTTWTDAAAAARSAGLAHTQAAIDAAAQNGLRPEDFAEAAYVAKHSPKLSPGALLHFARNGCWPVENIPTAAQLRAARSARADQLRAKTAEDSPPNCPADVLAAVTVRRLTAASLADQITTTERTAAERAERLRKTPR